MCSFGRSNSPIIIRLRSRSRRLSTRSSRLTIVAAARCEVVSKRRVRRAAAVSPALLPARLPAACARAPANDDWHLAPSGSIGVRPASRGRARARSRRGTRREGVPAGGRVERHGHSVRRETASNKPHSPRDSAPGMPLRNHADSAKMRNAAREMRFPVSRGTGDYAVSGRTTRGRRPAHPREQSVPPARACQPRATRPCEQSAPLADSARARSLLCRRRYA